VFAICYLLYWKKHFKHTMSLYLICYGIFRFSIEYLRGDHRGELLGFISPSQFWSILMVVIGVGLYFLLNWLFQKRFMEHASTLPSGGNAEENTVQTIEESSTEAAESVEETPAKTESESMEAEE
jgi:hypothetical protein